MVARVCFGGLGQLINHWLGHILPVVPESSMRPTTRTNIFNISRICLLVYGKIVRGYRCTERQDNQLLRVVQSNIARRATRAVENINIFGVVSFNKTTRAVVASQLVLSRVDVLVAGG